MNKPGDDSPFRRAFTTMYPAWYGHLIQKISWGGWEKVLDFVPVLSWLFVILCFFFFVVLVFVFFPKFKCLVQDHMEYSPPSLEKQKRIIAKLGGKKKQQQHSYQKGKKMHELTEIITYRSLLWCLIDTEHLNFSHPWKSVYPWVIFFGITLASINIILYADSGQKEKFLLFWKIRK